MFFQEKTPIFRQLIKTLRKTPWIVATDCTLIRWHAMHTSWWTSSRRRRHVQHIFRDKETTEGWRDGGIGRGETRVRDELFVVSCTLHPRTLTPRYPVYRVDPLPLTVSSIMSAASASDICTPALFPRKNFTAPFREYFLRVLSLVRGNTKI